MFFGKNRPRHPNSPLRQAAVTGNDSSPHSEYVPWSYRPNRQRERPMTLVQVLLAIFLPPVAAFLQVGLGLHFWINILLTLMGGLPGSIHALWLVAKDKK